MVYPAALQSRPVALPEIELTGSMKDALKHSGFENEAFR
jgi:hypothetical protein